MQRLLKPFYRVRRFRTLLLRSRRGALFVFGGIVVGAVAVAIAFAADYTSEVFSWLLTRIGYGVLILTPAGFALSRWLSSRYFPNSGGSGIPQAIAARQMHDAGARQSLVSLRMAFGKIMLLLLGLLCGASVGREGPTVQVGASIMFALGRLSPRRQPGLILAGASAGVAAAFNTPLAGVVFAIEEMSRSFETKTSSAIVLAVIVAGLTSLAIQGDYTYFGVTSAALGSSFQGWIAVPIVGILGGLLGGLFSRTLILFGRGGPGRLGAIVRKHPVAFAAICGLAAGLAGLWSGGAAFGTGYVQAKALVQGQGGVAHDFGVLKFLATLASSISGIPGGIFAPSLAVGAGLGSDVAALLPGAPTQAIIVMAMAAYFSGVVQAPITAFVIVSEMTGDHALLAPTMLASLIGFACSKLICPEGVYHALSHNFVSGSSHAPTNASRSSDDYASGHGAGESVGSSRDGLN